jgi:hypothetical protein
MDDALARRLILVKDSNGDRIRGEVKLESAETRWSLSTEVPWSPGEYQIVIGTELEDPAGNSIGRPFEVDQSRPISAHVSSEAASLSFRVRARGR